MSKKQRRSKNSQRSSRSRKSKSTADERGRTSPNGPMRHLAGIAGVAVLGVVLFWWWNASHQDTNAERPAEIAAAEPDRANSSADEHDKPAVRETDHSAGHPDSNHTAPAEHADAPAKSQPSGSFLDSFASPSSTPSASSAVQTNEALEKLFRDTLAAMNERDELTDRLSKALAANDEAGMKQLQSEGRSLAERLNRDLSRLEGDLKMARESRPDDPLVQWLTGELLMQVGGEPAEMLPYFQRAVDGGLERPRLLASLARVQFEANQFAAAYDSALKALELDEPDRYVWESYTRIAEGNERFDELDKRLDAAFANPATNPGWEQAIRVRLNELVKLWQRELSFREADGTKNDLPRVRLTIEHRRFGHDAAGNSTSKIETTGQGEVELELFEDQAPQTVANFISLVEKGFYDGTLFMVAESARYVQGGDPDTKNDDPSDDGGGGPGYVIADEFKRPDARDHFRGSISMVNTGPHSGGSQFFITLAPNQAFNTHFTVFGRVIAGQEVIDAITPGRTNRTIGHFGKLVPGDALVKAEVVRKRPHAYVATKQ